MTESFREEINNISKHIKKNLKKKTNCFVGQIKRNNKKVLYKEIH